MSLNWGRRRAGENIILPICWGNGLGIPRLDALTGVNTTGGSRFTLRVRESFTPRANKNVALKVRLFVIKRSAPAVAISLYEVRRFGSAVKTDGRIDELGVGVAPPSPELKI